MPGTQHHESLPQVIYRIPRQNRVTRKRVYCAQ